MSREWLTLLIRRMDAVTTVYRSGRHHVPGTAVPQAGFPYPDIWDSLRRVFDAYGLERCMWGTNWTRAVRLLTYEQGVEAFRVTDWFSDSDRDTLMVGTPSRIYGWTLGS